MNTPVTPTDKDALIAASLRRIEALVAQNAVVMAENARLAARVAELEAKLGFSPETPDNSSPPPSKGQKPSPPSIPKRKVKPHPGVHRLLHPDPTRQHDVLAVSCQACRADVSGAQQSPCEVYDRVEIPAIVPDVTRVSLHGGTCPCCAERFKAEPPADLEVGSPFGPNVRAFVIYLRAVQGIPPARLRDVPLDLFGLTVGEGALVNVLSASAVPFKAAVSLIEARLLVGTAIASDETGVRVGRANRWPWVFHHGDGTDLSGHPSTMLRMSEPLASAAHRSNAVVEAFLGDHRPDFWTSDRLGARAGWARKEHQVCLAHLIREARYAIDSGDAVLGPGLKHPLERACASGRRRATLKASTPKVCEADPERRLDGITVPDPTHPAGIKLKRTIRKVRSQFFVLIQNRDPEATNNGSDRALKPRAVYREITNGFRQKWGARLYAEIRFVIETARRRSVRAVDAIRLTLRGDPICTPA